MDDEILNREFLQSFLLQIGFDVAEATDGDTALGLIASWQPDLVLMDVMMPGMDGNATTRKIRERWPELKVVGLSANVFEEAERKAYESGMNLYVRKPYKEIELLHAIGEMLSVTFRYENEHGGEGSEVKAANCFKPDLSLLADEQISALSKAASFGDYYHLLELLAEIDAPAGGPLQESVQCMREMVEKYDYEALEIFWDQGGTRMDESFLSNSRHDILIVDDVPENLQILALMLKDQGYSVRPVPSGRMAPKRPRPTRRT